MLRNWRAWTLLVLLVGPVLAYIGFGTLWLFQRGWLLPAGVLWFTSGIVFTVLAARWTRTQRQLLPPLDWDAPHTFSQSDRTAWTIVEEEAEQGDALDQDVLSGVDVYMETGRRLTRRLAQHYHPDATDPIEHVPIVELLTALELAADDLNQLCRQVPGGDLVTPAHWKRAVKVAGYLQRANDIYSYLLPIFSPISGLARLGTQQWVVKPAWKNMQQNLLRWFFRAYVNRLGTHLIELYSGRLVIGTEQYRKLTGKGKGARTAALHDLETSTLTVVVAGARDAGKTRLIEALEAARTGDLSRVKTRLDALGLDDTVLERLKSIRWVETPGYTVTPGSDSARDRATRKEAVEAAIEADLLLLVVDGRRVSDAADVAFATAWDRWYVEHPGFEPPPALVVVTAADAPHLGGGEWQPPYSWTGGLAPREAAVRARLEALRAALPPTFRALLAVGLPEKAPFGVVEHVLPALAAELHPAERAALIRRLRLASTRSKARRFMNQVGQQGRSLWSHLTSGRRAPADAPTRRRAEAAKRPTG